VGAVGAVSAGGVVPTKEVLVDACDRDRVAVVPGCGAGVCAGVFLEASLPAICDRGAGPRAAVLVLCTRPGGGNVPVDPRAGAIVPARDVPGPSSPVPRCLVRVR